MAFIPLPNTIKVVFEYTIGGKLAVNIIFVRKPSTVTPSDLATVADNMRAWWNDNMKPLTTTNTQLNRLVLTDQTVANGITLDFTTGLPLIGTNALPPPTAATAVISSLRTGFSGRSFRGRVYWPTGNEEDYTDQAVTLGLTAAVLAAVNALRGVINTIGFDWVVASRQANGVPRVTGVTTPVISLLVNNRIDTQRRRLIQA